MRVYCPNMLEADNDWFWYRLKVGAIPVAILLVASLTGLFVMIHALSPLLPMLNSGLFIFVGILFSFLIGIIGAGMFVDFYEQKILGLANVHFGRKRRYRRVRRP